MTLFTLDYLRLRRVNKWIFLKDCTTHNRHSPNSYLYYIQILIQVTSSCNNYMQIITILSVTYKEGEWKQSIPKAKVERESEPFTYSVIMCDDIFSCSMCFSLFYISIYVICYMAHPTTISVLWDICPLRGRFRCFIFWQKKVHVLATRGTIEEGGKLSTDN